MSEPISLKAVEQKAFRSIFDDGLWDIFLGCFFLMFVIAPLLSPYLGDFWSSAVFLSFWAAAFVALFLIRKFVVTPRIGTMKFDPVRRRKIMRFTVGMLVLNILAAVLGFYFFVNFRTVPGQLVSVGMGIGLMVFLSLLAYFLDVNRLYVYGLMVGVSPLIGEWLWGRGLTSHHGFPLTFGVASAVMILVGSAILVRLVRSNPLPPEGAMPEGS
jgi:MFS family permease